MGVVVEEDQILNQLLLVIMVDLVVVVVIILVMQELEIEETELINQQELQFQLKDIMGEHQP